MRKQKETRLEGYHYTGEQIIEKNRIKNENEEYRIEYEKKT